MTEQTRETQAQVAVSENIRVRSHDADRLRRVEPRFDELSKQGKLGVISYVPPVAETSASNTTTIELHRSIAEMVNPNASGSWDASHLAFGTGSTAPASGDSSLNNEVYRAGVTSTSTTGAEFLTTTLLDTSEANGNTITEIGLFTASSGGRMFNHSLISDHEKKSTNTLTVDCTLTFSAP